MCESNDILFVFLAVLSVLIVSAIVGVVVGAALERKKKPWRPKPDSFLAIDWRHQERKDLEKRRRGEL